MKWRGGGKGGWGGATYEQDAMALLACDLKIAEAAGGAQQTGQQQEVCTSAVGLIPTKQGVVVCG